MAEIQSDRKQRQRVHLTAIVLFVLATLFFFSATFLSTGA